MFNFFSELKSKLGDIKSKVIFPYQIVMVGNSLLYLEGSLSLMTLSHENIVVKVKDAVVVISGENLSVKDLSDKTITVVGKIKSWETV